MQIPDKVTTPPITGGNPFRSLKNIDVKNSAPTGYNSTTLTSHVVTTISGRTVFRPKRK